MDYHSNEIKYKIIKGRNLYCLYEYNSIDNKWYEIEYAFTFWGAKYKLRKLTHLSKYKGKPSYYTSDGKLVKESEHMIIGPLNQIKTKPIPTKKHKFKYRRK